MVAGEPHRWRQDEQDQQRRCGGTIVRQSGPRPGDLACMLVDERIWSAPRLVPRFVPPTPLQRRQVGRLSRFGALSNAGSDAGPAVVCGHRRARPRDVLRTQEQPRVAPRWFRNPAERQRPHAKKTCHGHRRCHAQDRLRINGAERRCPVCVRGNTPRHAVIRLRRMARKMPSNPPLKRQSVVGSGTGEYTMSSSLKFC